MKNRVCCLYESSVWVGQLAIPWGTSGMREDKKVLKKTQTVHMTDTLWGGTKTADIDPCPSDSSSAAAADSSLCLSASSSAWRHKTTVSLATSTQFQIVNLGDGFLTGFGFLFSFCWLCWSSGGCRWLGPTTRARLLKGNQPAVCLEQEKQGRK